MQSFTITKIKYFRHHCIKIAHDISSVFHQLQKKLWAVRDMCGFWGVFLGCISRTVGNKLGTKSGSFMQGTKFTTGEGRKQKQLISLTPPCFRHFTCIAKRRERSGSSLWKSQFMFSLSWPLREPGKTKQGWKNSGSEAKQRKLSKEPQKPHGSSSPTDSSVSCKYPMPDFYSLLLLTFSSPTETNCVWPFRSYFLSCSWALRDSDFQVFIYSCSN